MTWTLLTGTPNIGPISSNVTVTAEALESKTISDSVVPLMMFCNMYTYTVYIYMYTCVLSVGGT